MSTEVQPDSQLVQEESTKNEQLPDGNNESEVPNEKPVEIDNVQKNKGTESTEEKPVEVVDKDKEDSNKEEILEKNDEELSEKKEKDVSEKNDTKADDGVTEKGDKDVTEKEKKDETENKEDRDNKTVNDEGKAKSAKLPPDERTYEFFSSVVKASMKDQFVVVLEQLQAVQESLNQLRHLMKRSEKNDDEQDEKRTEVGNQPLEISAVSNDEQTKPEIKNKENTENANDDKLPMADTSGGSEERDKDEDKAVEETEQEETIRDEDSTNKEENSETPDSNTKTPDTEEKPETSENDSDNQVRETPDDRAKTPESEAIASNNNPKTPESEANASEDYAKTPESEEKPKTPEADDLGVDEETPETIAQPDDGRESQATGKTVNAPSPPQEPPGSSRSSRLRNRVKSRATSVTSQLSRTHSAQSLRNKTPSKPVTPKP